MKKVLIMTMLLLFMCGCGNEENSLIKNNYIDKNNYNEIYHDLTKIINDVSYIPSKNTEKKFYEMVEIISDNCEKFTNDELVELYKLININYQFNYSGNRYDNTKYQDDLSTINACITE